jgi:hypothetical protein
MKNVSRGKVSSQREALERFFNAPDFPGIASVLPNREELYAERLFHRQSGSAGSGS